MYLYMCAFLCMNNIYSKFLFPVKIFSQIKILVKYNKNKVPKITLDS